MPAFGVCAAYDDPLALINGVRHRHRVGVRQGCRITATWFLPRLRRTSTCIASGRSGSDIFLDDITVSRHAEFRSEDGRFRIVDAGSLSGTHVNGQPVDSTVLANGDVIQIGKYRLVLLTRPTPE